MVVAGQVSAAVYELRPPVHAGLLSRQARERATAYHVNSESLAAALRPTINHHHHHQHEHKQANLLLVNH